MTISPTLYPDMQREFIISLICYDAMEAERDCLRRATVYGIFYTVDRGGVFFPRGGKTLKWCLPLVVVFPTSSNGKKIPLSISNTRVCT